MEAPGLVPNKVFSNLLIKSCAPPAPSPSFKVILFISSLPGNIPSAVTAMCTGRWLSAELPFGLRRALSVNLIRFPPPGVGWGGGGRGAGGYRPIIHHRAVPLSQPDSPPPLINLPNKHGEDALHPSTRPDSTRASLLRFFFPSDFCDRSLSVSMDFLLTSF